MSVSVFVCASKRAFARAQEASIRLCFWLAYRVFMISFFPIRNIFRRNYYYFLFEILYTFLCLYVLSVVVFFFGCGRLYLCICSRHRYYGPLFLCRGFTECSHFPLLPAMESFTSTFSTDISIDLCRLSLLLLLTLLEVLTLLIGFHRYQHVDTRQSAVSLHTLRKDDNKIFFMGRRIIVFDS